MACPVDEPDSVQISWDTPCLEGTWLLDTELGCRMWDWHPAPEDTATWTICRAGIKAGSGVVQWFEHGRPIDRFEGTYVEGRRQGPGNYRWNETEWFDGVYESDVPDGPGTAHLAGEVFAGQWHRGCLEQGIRVVAIGVPRKSCAASKYRIARDPTLHFHKRWMDLLRALILPDGGFYASLSEPHCLRAVREID